MDDGWTDDPSQLDILVVDDDPRHCEVIEAVLAPLRMRIVGVHSGRAALSEMLHHDFTAVLLDVRMPDLDGFETAELIRSRERTRNVPIVFMTAVHRADEFALRGYQLGGVDYLILPLAPEILRSKVRAILSVAMHERQTERHARELERLNADLLVARANAELASRYKSKFLAHMSHEFRTPLNAIMGFAALVHDGQAGPVNDEQREFLDEVLSSSRHLLAIVNDVLDLARVESGRLEFHPEPVDPAAVAREACETMRGLAEAKHLELSCRGAQLGQAVLDPGRLRQVLFNYLSNAIKFTPAGGTVEVAVERDETGSGLRVEVRDSGPGIKPQDLGRLFTEFEQLDAGPAWTGGGTGIGLALTKRIVEEQGGSVGVESATGIGSTFHAVLPGVLIEDAGGADQPPAEPPPAARGRRTRRSAKTGG